MTGFALIDESKPSVLQIAKTNIDYIISSVFYICGLVIGTSFYRSIGEGIINKIISTISGKCTDYIAIFLLYFCVYVSIYAVTVMLGLCIVGFPFVNILPLLIGVFVGVQHAYYYVSFGAKGIGYCVLLSTPEISLFMTILVLTIKNSSDLSRYIFDSAKRKIDMNTELNPYSYLKSFLWLGFLVVIVALVNALIRFLLQPIIHL